MATGPAQGYKDTEAAAASLIHRPDAGTRKHKFSVRGDGRPFDSRTGLSSRVGKRLDANSQRRSSGVSVHFLAWPRCMNLQAEQPVASAIGPAQRVLTRPMSLFPSVRSRPILSRRGVGLGEHGGMVN